MILCYSGPSELRRLLSAASKRNMTSGEYVFNILRIFDDKTYFDWTALDLQTESSAVRENYRPVLMMHMLELDIGTVSSAEALRSEWAEQSRLHYNATPLVMPWLTSAYQAIQVLGEAVDSARTQNLRFNYSDGAAFTAVFRNRAFSLDLRNLTINSLGQRPARLVFRFFSTLSGRFEPFMESYEETISLFGATSGSRIGLAAVPYLPMSRTVASEIKDLLVGHQ